MRYLPPILYRYIVKELFVPFFVILFVFTGLLFLARSLKLIELIVNKTASILDILILFSYVVPQFLEMATPMAFLLSIIIAFGRLSADSELIVMRSVGLSLNKLILPLLLYSISVSIFAAGVSLSLRPWANYQLGLGLFKLATAQASSGLISGSFNEIGPITIYARDIVDNGSLLSDVLISDRRSPETQRMFFAKRSKIFTDDENRSIIFQLYDGSMQEGTGLNLSQTEYALNSIKISESELSDSDDLLKRKKSKEMSTSELNSQIEKLSNRTEDKPTITESDSDDLINKNTDDLKEDNQENDSSIYKYQSLAELKVELHKRYVLPASCFAVALLALALGIQPSRGANKWGTTLSFISGIIFILIYYISFALVSAISETGGNYVGILMWMPNIIFLILGIVLFRQVGTERWSGVTEVFLDFSGRTAEKINQFFKRGHK